MANNSIAIEIEAGTAGLINGLKQADSAVVKFANNVTSNLFPIRTAAAQVSNGIKTGFKDAFTDMAKGAAVGSLVAGGIMAVAGAIKGAFVGAIDAASEQEDAFNRLSQALRATGDYSKVAMSDFGEFAAQMQATTKYGDETVVSMVALAKNFGATNQQAKDLVQAAANLAATFGGSLEENVQKLGKSLQGNAGRLGQNIGAIKNLTEAQLKAGDAIDIINSKFSGNAANELNTYSGKVAATGNAFSDMQEEIGTFITKNGLTTAAVDTAKGAFQLFTGALHNLNIELGLTDRNHTEAVDKANELSIKYAELTDKAAKYRAAANGDMSGLNWFERLGLSAKFANLQADLFEGKQKNILAEIDKNLPADAATTSGGDNKAGSGISKSDQAMIDSRNAAYAALEQSRADYNAYQIEQDVASQAITEENYAFELQRLTDANAMKIEATFAAEEAKANAIKDGQTKQLTLLKIQQDKEAALDKNKLDSQKKLTTAQISLEEQKKAAMIGIMSGTFTLLSTLAKDGSREQFLIQKAAAVAEIMIARGKAIALVPAQTAHIPFPANLAAAAELTTYANIQAGLGLATVAAATIKGFEDGGVVGGSSYHGDRQLVRINSGEMVLNRNQQAELFRQANGSGSGMSDDAVDRIVAAVRSAPVIIEVNGRELARAMRDEKANGFAF